MYLSTKLLSIFALCGFLSMQVGCAALQKDLPTILTYVQDSALILNTIQSYTNLFFAAHPNATLEAEVNSKIAATQTALDAALRATQGATDLSTAQYAAAFAPFMAAYDDLLALAKQIGIESTTSVTAPKAVPGGLLVPTPLVFASVVK
jgi:hypothetical protein